MIRSFRHKRLRDLLLRDDRRKVRADLVERCVVRLTVLDQAERIEELAIPGFDFHAWRGKPRRYAIQVNGPWCITFEWLDGEPCHVDLEQYH